MTNEEFIKSITLESEEWRDVADFEGLYKVSSLGRVVSLAKYVNNRFKNVYKEPRLLLPFSKEIIDILREHKEIKGIIFGIYAMNEYKMVLMYNDDKTLNNLEKNEYFKVNDEEFNKSLMQKTGSASRIKYRFSRVHMLMEEILHD